MRKDGEKESNRSKTRKSSKKRKNKHKNDLSKRRDEVSSSSKREKEDSIEGMERELSEIGITSNLESSRGLIRLAGGTAQITPVRRLRDGTSSKREKHSHRDRSELSNSKSQLDRSKISTRLD